MDRINPSRVYRLWVVMAVVVLAAPLLPLALDMLVPPRAPGVFTPGRVGAAGTTTGVSHLKITPANVDQLEVAWTYRTGDVSANEDGRAGTAFELGARSKVLP